MSPAHALSKIFKLFFSSLFYFFISIMPFVSSFLFFFSLFPTERLERDRERKKERPRDGENQRELEEGVRWASHRLGWTTAPGPVGLGPTLVRPKSLEFRHFLGTQTVENPFFFG